MFDSWNIFSELSTLFQVISSIFDSVFALGSNIMHVLANGISSILAVVPVINSAINLPFDILSMVHPLLGACVSLVVGVSVTKLVLGWGNA